MKVISMVRAKVLKDPMGVQMIRPCCNACSKPDARWKATTDGGETFYVCEPCSKTLDFDEEEMYAGDLIGLGDAGDLMRMEAIDG